MTPELLLENLRMTHWKRYPRKNLWRIARFSSEVRETSCNSRHSFAHRSAAAFRRPSAFLSRGGPPMFFERFREEARAPRQRYKTTRSPYVYAGSEVNVRDNYT